MRHAGYIHLLLASAALASGGPPTFQMLMSPNCLPQAQHGMQVELATVENAQLRIRTTGAEFVFDAASGKGVLRQRIGHPRDVLRLEIQGSIKAPPRLTHTGPGFALAHFDSPKFDLRANGDSLIMLHALEPLHINVHSAIDAAFASSFRSNHIVCDEWGGFGLYCSRPDIDDHFDRYEETTVAYDLPADTVIWLAVCPPKPYDWKRASSDQVVWHWSNESAYPPNDMLTSWSKAGNIVLLQSEVMLWKDWNLGFEPRLGLAEFARVRQTLHSQGMRFIVYTSPFYYLRGTSLEPQAMNSFVHFTNWPPGTATGENIDLFLPEIAKVMREYKPDGLYFDGQYKDNPAALYLLARRAREIVGEGGLLEWHSTFALGQEQCSLPAADAYVDFILRGEGQDKQYDDDDYLRFFVSGYNVHNSIGVICNNAKPPTPELIARLLAVNGRMHTLVAWLSDPGLVAMMSGYREQLKDVDTMRRRIERTIDERQSRLAERVRIAREEHRRLRQPPTWSKPKLHDDLSSTTGWQSLVSPLNGPAFTTGAQGLRITARASTFAYLQEPVNQPLQGLVVKLRRGTDGGASWGPSACVAFADGEFIRVGLRNDGLVQGEIGGQQLLGSSVRPEEWVWLRARWGRREGVVELSRDGKSFSTLWYFQHAGGLAAGPAKLLVGKVPYNAQPQDFTEPGPVGTCEIGLIELY